MQLRRQIPARLADVDRLSIEVRSLLRRGDLSHLAFSVEVVARECLNNAVLHGNADLRGARVTLELYRGPHWLRLRVADEGPGVPAYVRRNRPVAAEDEPNGRGLEMIRSLGDRVRFNRRGNTITVWFRTESKKNEQSHGRLRH